ncbi:HlyD family secretion protein [Desulfopila sp. IMCC35008]|uniref:HlyD family secretion protein n=1 Tax=Desulfopila sp. IMCC35008 TaxID=2653858 RepID=UPI0013D35952|nr:HlyD family efflux transporter periplasmic adaptor subunit [Desulfopila sp. IMCC35008]
MLRNYTSYLFPLLLVMLLFGCQEEPEKALGTLEWDRVNSRAIASELIVDIFVDEGQQVEKDTPILVLDNRKIHQQCLEHKARLDKARWYLIELESGPRSQTIAEAEARLVAAQATLENREKIYQRQQQLYKTDIASREHLDIARSNFINAREKVREYSQQLNELTTGTRFEKIQQARAEFTALEAGLAHLELLEADYTVLATRDGLVESLPFNKGDRPPAGSVVCTLLTGEGPWARVYIPEPYRSAMQVDREYRLKVDGLDKTLPCRLRSISSEASFTPYYALTERDRSRLAYVAELDLIGNDTLHLTAGTPVQLVLEGL